MRLREEALGINDGATKISKQKIKNMTLVFKIYLAAVVAETAATGLYQVTNE